MTSVSSRASIRVLVVDRNALVREGVTLHLAAHKDIQVVAKADTVNSAIHEATRFKPDVAVIDADLASGDLCAKIKSVSPHTLTILHATSPTNRQSSHADAVVLKQLLGDHLVDTIRNTASKLHQH